MADRRSGEAGNGLGSQEGGLPHHSANEKNRGYRKGRDEAAAGAGTFIFKKFKTFAMNKPSDVRRGEING